MMHPHHHSRAHRRRLGANLIPWTLDFGVSQQYSVNLGHAASIDDLHAADFTVDLYWYYTPAPGANFFHTLIGQGDWSTATGWRLSFSNDTERLYLAVIDGAAAAKTTTKPAIPAENWYYIRLRREDNTIYLSYNAGAEATSATLAAGGTASDLDLTIGSASGTHRALGKVCYAHLWNNNQGALATLPTSPFPIDANTVARYLFKTDITGIGTTLADDSGNNNNGTITGASWKRAAPTLWTP